MFAGDAKMNRIERSTMVRGWLTDDGTLAQLRPRPPQAREGRQHIASSCTVQLSIYYLFICLLRFYSLPSNPAAFVVMEATTRERSSFRRRSRSKNNSSKIGFLVAVAIVVVVAAVACCCRANAVAAFACFRGGPPRQRTPLSPWSSSLTSRAALLRRQLRHRHCRRQQQRNRPTGNGAPSLGAASAAQQETSWPSAPAAFDAAVYNRYACKRFRRYTNKKDGGGGGGTAVSTTTTSAANATTISTPSESDPAIVKLALECLELARQSPSAFNTQPYKVVLVYRPEQKLAVSKYCLGPNRQRVLDADCTAVFLADRQIAKTLGTYRSFVERQLRRDGIPLNRKLMRVTQLYIWMFSSGYPFPRVVRAAISFFVRTGMSFLNLLVGRFYPLPTLASSETWSSKQAAMAAMTYMLACSSRNVQTIPMEGVNAAGIRRALRIPSRYAVPLVVSTGIAAERASDNKNDDDTKIKETGKEEQKAASGATERNEASGVRQSSGSSYDDESSAAATITASSSSSLAAAAVPAFARTRRYPAEDVVYGNVFGSAVVPRDLSETAATA